MANNKIQIKRSTSNATVTGLSNGELAFTQAGNVFFIGAPDGSSGSIRIGGLMVPGTLTANQALVANATSGINQIQVGNVAMVGATQTFTANGSTGSAGDVLSSGGSAANAYWVAVSSLGTNVNATFAWTNVHSFANNVIFNGGVNVNSSITASGSTGTAGYVLTTNGAGGGAPYWSSVSALSGGLNVDSTFTWTNTHVFQNTITFNSYISVVANAVVANATGVYTTGVVNAASHTSGAIGTGAGGTVQNTTVMFVGNNTVNTNITSAGLTVSGTATIANSTGVYTGVVNASTLSTGAAFTANSTLVNAAAINVTGQVNTATLYATTSANIASAVQATSTGVWTTGTVNAASLTVGTAFTANSTVVNAVSYYSGSLLVANSTVINATHLVGKTEGGLNVNSALTSNNSSNFGGQLPAYYTNASNITTGTLPWAQAPAGTVNTAGSFTLAGNTTLAGTNTVISSNLTTTGVSITGTSTDISFRNVTFSGNLIVSGTVVTVNTAQLMVNDNIIQLAYNQTTTDTVDTGFSSVAGNSTAIWYSGIVRVAGSSTNAAPVFRVFGSNTNPNTSGTVDTSSNTRTGFLQSYLIPYGAAGALVVNATNISITGNSTVAVAIAANTLSLSTALPGTSGGTGLSTIANNSLIFGNSTNGFNALAFNTTGGYVLQSNGTAIVYDTLDGGTF